MVALRDAGYDVVYAAERTEDPGDRALRRESLETARVTVTQDRDFGALIRRHRLPHAGVILVDDLRAPAAEALLLLEICKRFADELTGGAILRARGGTVRIHGARSGSG